MPNLDPLDRWSPYALALLRIVTALIFMLHGTQKLVGFPAPPQGGMPPLFLLYGVGAILEIMGGLLLLIGLLHASCSFHSGRRDGGGVLDVPCASKPVPGAQWR